MKQYRDVTIHGQTHSVCRLLDNNKVTIGQTKDAKDLVVYVKHDKSFHIFPFLEGTTLFERLESAALMPATEVITAGEFKDRIRAFCNTEVDKVYKPNMSYDDVFSAFEELYGPVALHDDNCDYQTWEDESEFIAPLGVAYPIAGILDNVIIPKDGNDYIGGLIREVIIDIVNTRRGNEQNEKV